MSELADKAVGERLSAGIDFGKMKQDGLVVDVEHTSSTVLYPVMGTWEPIKEHPAFSIPPLDELELYVHLPFCAYKCGFCQYNTATNKPRPSKEEFVNLLLKEQKLLSETPLFMDSTITGVYFGGGTPTELDADLLKRLLNELIDNLHNFAPREISIEASPDSIKREDGLEKLKICKGVGIDRLSIGVQTFNDEILSSQNRRHSERDAQDAIDIALEYFDHINIDLIYGFPGQTFDLWENDLSKAVESGVPSITLYALRIYPKDRYTVNPSLIKIFQKDPLRFPNEENVLLMRIMGEVFLHEYGYRQLINNWFTKGVVHKAQYDRWKVGSNHIRVNRDGFGPSTYKDHESFVYSNHLLEEWREALKNGKLPHCKGREVPPDERLRRDVIYGVKIMDGTGIDLEALSEKYGINPLDYFKKEIEILRKHGLIEVGNSSLQLSKTGCYIAETVVKAFYSPECRKSMGF